MDRRVLACALLALTACGGGHRDVVVGTVARHDVTEVVDAPGTVAARAQATLTAPADGTYAEVLVRDGAHVRTGQAILRIDSPSAQSRLRQAKQADASAAVAVPRLRTPDLTPFLTQLDAAVAGATPAIKAQYAAARAQALAAIRSVEAGVGSLNAAVTALGNAQRVQTQAAVAIAQQTVDALVVRAPIGGVVQLGGTTSSSSGGGVDALLGQLPASVQGQAASALGSSGGTTTAASVVVGAPVSTGSTVATVFDLSSLLLTASVDETDVFLVHPGVEADVELDAVPDAHYSARVTAVDLSPTESSRGGVTYVVRLALGPGIRADGDPAPKPRPGMSAVVDLRVRSAKSAVAVPAAAVIRQGDRDAVWLVTDGRAHARVVRLGAQGDDYVQVLDGVRPGDRIVTKGADVVSENDKVP